MNNYVAYNKSKQILMKHRQYLDANAFARLKNKIYLIKIASILRHFNLQHKWLIFSCFLVFELFKIQSKLKKIINTKLEN